MRTAGIFTLLAILVVGVIWLVPDSSQLGPANNATSTGEPSGQFPTAPADWQTYNNENFDFSFRYPPSATTSVEADRVKVQLIGPDSEPNTEITDGFTVYVHRAELGEAASTEAFVQTYYQEEATRLETVERPQEASLATKNGYSFTLEGQTDADIVYRVFPAGDQRVFVTVAIVSDPNDEGYEDMIETMLGTLQ